MMRSKKILSYIIHRYYARTYFCDEEFEEVFSNIDINIIDLSKELVNIPE